MDIGVNATTGERWINDNMILKKEIVDSLNSSIEKTNIKFPQNIFLEETDEGIKMSLSMVGIGQGNGKLLNMQSDAAAFEGWAAVLYTHYLKTLNNKDSGIRKIILGTQKELDVNSNFGELRGHYPRFLFRAMKFSEEYSNWFELDKNLKDVVKGFKKWYEKENLINNQPSKARESNNQKTFENPTTENEVENYFVYNPEERTKLLELANMKSGKLYRQLPVGLFKGKVAKNNSVFTRGKSAIDLWAVDDKNIALFELKTNNKMIGIVTELFFYSQYVNDVFVSKNNIQCDDSKDDKSGYHLLTTDDTAGKKIKSFFLTNGLHPLITDEVIALLNDNNKEIIKYGNIEYDFRFKIIW